MQPDILIVEDSPSIALTYESWLTPEGLRARIVTTAEEALKKIRDSSYRAILLDLNLPGRGGMEFLKDLRAAGVATPVIVITGETSADIAVAAVQAGAADFISKPVQKERLLLTLKNLLERQSLKAAVDGYRTLERDGFCDFIGKSPAMQVIYRILENAAQSRAAVFITGESGTGKELAARAIHALSPRRDEVFEAVNCAAIPANLLESEMFGHARGAFTGAVSAFTGAAARAHKGTLFLDELAEMPAELQSKLLRFTQTGVFRPVGAQAEVAVDVRFVSATNRDPLGAVKDSLLREDLYYRLNVIPVHLPPLRERGEDALLIAKRLLTRISKEEKKHFRDMHDSAASFILSCAWPGNVRQLENVMRRAVVLHSGEILTADMLEHGHERQAPRPAAEALQQGPAPLPLRDIERQAIEQAIARCHGNILQAARQLEVNPSTLHRKLGKWRNLS